MSWLSAYTAHSRLPFAVAHNHGWTPFLWSFWVCAQHLKKTSKPHQPRCSTTPRSEFQVNFLPRVRSRPTLHPSPRALRDLFRSIRPVPASRHSSYRPFCFRDLESCTHVFKRVDSIRKPLEPPYVGPFKVIQRNDNRTFVIDVNGQAVTVSTDQLKPAYCEDFERSDASEPASQDSQPPTSSTRHVTFPVQDSVTGGGVTVATPPPLTQRHQRKQSLVPRDVY